MAADGTSNIIPLGRKLAPREVSHPHAPAGTYGFPLNPPPAPRFRPGGTDGSVYLRTAWLNPASVESLLALFQAEAGRTGDWRLHDELLAARDGIVEPPPGAA